MAPQVCLQSINVVFPYHTSFIFTRVRLPARQLKLKENLCVYIIIVINVRSILNS